jgi:hypothetical protein
METLFQISLHVKNASGFETYGTFCMRIVLLVLHANLPGTFILMKQGKYKSCTIFF